ncbi:hypothetical protein [Salipiger aestuarii]|uniref:hypothetical protein n=1 Tax=Salipiger aestuarii TaxID=568098 RepID=UPI00123A2DF1|nr:hypothetical protein [Salipiger aestuarii]
MSSRFISTVLAVSMAITAIVPLTATPAPADTARTERRDDTARLLMGAAALAFVGTAIARHKDRDRHEDSRKKDPPRTVDPRRHAKNVGALPARCLEDLRRAGQAFDAACLAKRGVHPRALPQRCEITLRTRFGSSRAYDAACLSRSGYRADGGQARHRDDDRRRDANRYLPRPYQRGYGQRYILRPGH